MKIIRLHNTELSPESLKELPVETLSALAAMVASVLFQKVLEQRAAVKDSGVPA